jgi:hypothetical protein
MLSKLKNIFKKMDKMFCTYLGLEYEIVYPNTVKLKTDQILISNTESFKRHSYTQNLDEFNAINLSQVSQCNKEKLGISIGKAIAKNLIISFEDIQIKREEINE